MLRRASLLGLIFLLAAGCRDATSPSSVTMTGTWEGAVFGSTVLLTTLEQQRQISGSGSIAGNTTSLAVSVTGTHVHPTVSLLISAVGFSEMNYTATFVGTNELSGNVQGSGFTGQQLVLTRRQ